MQRALKANQDNHGSIAIPVLLGDDDGLDSYEMRQFKKAVVGNEELFY